MPFNTFNYLTFLPIVFALHYLSPNKFRWLVLVSASIFFYAELKAYYLIGVLFCVTTITFFAGILIDHQRGCYTRKLLLWVSISVNVLILFLLKYLSFGNQFLIQLFKAITPLVPESKAVVTIGVSYFIFQAISYLIDVYLEIIKPERHFGHFALYMSFFPKLLQGPIERGNDLLPQFKAQYSFDYNKIRTGMVLFAVGMFKKVVIADRLALMVNPVFENVYAYKGFSLLLATYYYSLQIYFDFSGYTDMALGTAMMFNIALTPNFNSPYFATSIADFWRRWHISFSTWILDYIFKPLQLSWRHWGNIGTVLALVITFLISGIWHGASWGFVVWGGLHGVYMASSIFYKPFQKKLHKKLNLGKSAVWAIWQKIFIFNLVSFAWIFFRANKIYDAIYIIKNAAYGLFFTVFTTSIYDVLVGKLNLSLGQGMGTVVIILLTTIGMMTADYSRAYFKVLNFSLVLRWISYYSFAYGVYFLGIFKTASKFVYFRF